jgi:hypothetical protein
MGGQLYIVDHCLASQPLEKCYVVRRLHSLQQFSYDALHLGMLLQEQALLALECKQPPRDCVEVVARALAQQRWPCGFALARTVDALFGEQLRQTIASGVRGIPRLPRQPRQASAHISMNRALLHSAREGTCCCVSAESKPCCVGRDCSRQHARTRRQQKQERARHARVHAWRVSKFYEICLPEFSDMNFRILCHMYESTPHHTLSQDTPTPPKKPKNQILKIN